VSTPALFAARFGGPRRASALSSTTRAEGGIEWSSKLALPQEDSPRDVLLWQSMVIVDTRSQIIAISAAGVRLWGRDKRAGSPSVAVSDRLYFVSRGSQLTSVDSAGVLKLQEAPFPGLASREFSIMALWPLGEEFISTTYVEDPTYDEEQDDGPTPQPHVFAARSPMGSVELGWGEIFEGTLKLPPLLVPERDLWIAAIDQVIVVNYSTKEEFPRFDLSIADVVDWSADAAGLLCVAGYVGAHKSLVAVGLDGKVQWQWTDADGDDRWSQAQPPIRGKDGRVYALTDGRVLAIDAGRVAWTYDARSESLRHGALAGDGSFEVKDGRLLSTTKLRHGTALADGSILVTGNRTLRHIGANGNLLFSVSLPDDVLTPPVVDAEGDVYVATSTDLIKIR
jgi:hypothetical protein